MRERRGANFHEAGLSRAWTTSTVLRQAGPQSEPQDWTTHRTPRFLGILSMFSGQWQQPPELRGALVVMGPIIAKWGLIEQQEATVRDEVSPGGV